MCPRRATNDAGYHPAGWMSMPGSFVRDVTLGKMRFRECISLRNFWLDISADSGIIR
jgi:hypothetical protein